MQDLISVSNKNYKSKRTAWFKIIEDYNAVGGSQINYCKQHGIKVDHFAYYLSCWRKANNNQVEPTGFVEMQVADTVSDKWIIDIGYGIKLEVPNTASMQTLTELILNIRAKSC